MRENLPHYDFTHKNPNPRLKNFFQIQTRRLPESADYLNSSLAQPVGELWNCKVAEHFAKKWHTRDLRGNTPSGKTKNEKHTKNTGQRPLCNLSPPQKRVAQREKMKTCTK